MTLEPALSVIVASYNARNTIRQCLESLAANTARLSMEVIVVDSSSDGTGRLIAGEFPWVKLLGFERRHYCGDARNAGLERARGRIIALIDSDCIADERWAEEILEAHKKNPLPAIGGVIANGNPESFVGWAAYFCEFSDWMPERPAGLRTDIAGANMSYKREIFDQYGIFITGTYCSDTEFHWRLAGAGLRLYFEPAIQVFHRNITSLGRFLRHEFQHGRSFARVRVSAQNFSPARRAAYAFLIVFIAAKLFARIALRSLRNRFYRKHFIISSTLILIGVLSWSAGEACGYFRSK
ncbi:MAG: glycosyltransferase [Acidobacteria bacterium]|nr:glycosyltransferase [Acidobacteriota bacterium]